MALMSSSHDRGLPLKTQSQWPPWSSSKNHPGSSQKCIFTHPLHLAQPSEFTSNLSPELAWPRSAPLCKHSGLWTLAWGQGFCLWWYWDHQISLWINEGITLWLILAREGQGHSLCVLPWEWSLSRFQLPKGSSCNTHTCPWGRPRVLPGHCPRAVRYKQKQIQGPSLVFHTHQVPVPNLQPWPCIFPSTHSRLPQAALLCPCCACFLDCAFLLVPELAHRKRPLLECPLEPKA